MSSMRWNDEDDDDLDDDDLDDDEGGSLYSTRTHCDYCGTGHVKWKETHLGWRLVDKDTEEIHECLTYGRKNW